jgi:hypothetical protein
MHGARRCTMVVATSTSFDLEGLRCGYEGPDIDALLALYADEAVT